MRADEFYDSILTKVTGGGALTSPRGMATREILGLTGVLNMRQPVVRLPERRLNYRFMAAEALWVLDGRNDVAYLSKHVERTKQYSDNGYSFYGAYGPQFVDQLPYVVGKLRSDNDTRQAVMTIWRPRPIESKDVPCTIALAFQIRSNRLHTHVMMRSSDVFIGLPYDMFTFTMMSARVASELAMPLLSMGSLHYYAASGHVYDRDLDHAMAVLKGYAQYGTKVPGLDMPNPANPSNFQRVLDYLRLMAEGVAPEPRYTEQEWRFRP